MNSTRICVVRHGETDWNAARRMQGQIDIPLNDAGRAQAAATAVGLAGQRFDAVYSSDLMRTWQTAQPIAAACQLEVQAMPGLRERHYGRMQGMTPDEAKRHLPQVHAAYASRDPVHDLEGGESLMVFAQRVGMALDELVAAHTGETVLVVAHGGVLDIIYRMATGRDLAGPRDFPIPNAGLNWIEHDGAGWRLVAWGDLAHLDTALDEVTG